MIGSSDILKARILIVDDLEADILLIEQMLRGAGYVSIMSTRDSREVCELHRANRYDLIILDLQMPGMNGFQVMECLNKIELDGHVPVLVITVEPEHKLRAMKAGAKDFVSKPFELAEVLLRVHNLLEVRLLHRNETVFNKARLENSQRTTGLGDWEYDFSNHRLLWSEEVYRILGISRENSPPDADIFYHQVHPDDLAFVHREKDAVAKGLGRVDFEHRIIRPGGEVRHIHQIAEMFLDDQGHPARESGTIQDITERKLSEESLRQSEERYRLLFESNPSAMWVFDRSTFAFLTVNEAAIALYGYSREEFMRMSVKKIRPPELVQDFLDRSQSLSHEFRAEGRFQHLKKDGTVFPVDIYAHGIDFAGRQAQLVLAVDMTEPEHIAAALRASEARFRTLSESAPIGIFECDASGSVTYYNPALIALTGRPAEQSMGRSWEENIHSDDRAAMKAGWVLAVEKGNTWDQVQRLLQPGGSELWVHTLVLPSKDADGSITGFVGTVEDITQRRTAEFAMFESEERYRRLLVLSPDAQYVHVDDIITLVNPAMCKLLGAENPGQLLGKSVFDIVHPDYHEQLRSRRETVLSGHRITPVERKYVRLDGSIVEVEANAMAFDTNGRKEVQVIARDISNRKHAEEELRGKTALLEAQIESSIDGILIVDPKGKKILQNRRLMELMKIPREFAEAPDDEKQLKFMASVVLNPELFIERVQHLYANPHESSRDEIKLRDGTVLDRYSSPILSKDGSIYGRIWAFRDVTANRAAELALRESEERFKFVARAVSDVVWDRDLLANTLWWNDGFLTTFGFVAGEIEPSIESWASRIHSNERSRVVDSIHHAIKAGAESWNAEYRFRRKDGSYALVQDRGYILRDGAGKGIRMVGGMRDLTEQKKMEAQYLRAQRMEGIGTLAGGIAHDLNNVLAPIMMSIELLKFDPNIDPRRSKILDTINVSCRRGADLVRQVLSFAQGLDGQRVAIQLRHLIDDLEGIISETFPRNIRIVSDSDKNLWPITGDPTQIHQVLLNLTVNSRDAMPQGGVLTLAASNVTIDAQYAGTSHEANAGTYVLLRVTDTGVGIPPDVRERMFEPFFTTKEVGKGTGLGLATVHTVVKSHGGFLIVESEVGRGTTFKVYLPADPSGRPVATAHPFKANLPVGRDELVLVVDDEFSIRDITLQTLETFGYRVITASDGADAIALYAKHTQEIAVVLMDMMMPVMDGVVAIQVLKRINPSVRIIAASGLEIAENIAKASIAGAHDFLPKPFTAETLVKLVREVIDRPASPAAR